MGKKPWFHDFQRSALWKPCLFSILLKCDPSWKLYWQKKKKSHFHTGARLGKTKSITLSLHRHSCQKKYVLSFSPGARYSTGICNIHWIGAGCIRFIWILKQSLGEKREGRGKVLPWYRCSHISVLSWTRNMLSKRASLCPSFPCFVLHYWVVSECVNCTPFGLI